MGGDIFFFFDRKPEALPLYEAFEREVLARIEKVTIRVQKTQITFRNRHNFAFVSFLPVRKTKERPKTYITVSFGLSYPLHSLRIDAMTEPCPNRWTHHLLITAPEEIDAELMGWIQEATAFSAGKRR